MYHVRCECHAILDEDGLVHERGRQCRAEITCGNFLSKLRFCLDSINQLLAYSITAEDVNCTA